MNKKMYKSMAKEGRGKDTKVAHIAPNEIVIPHHLATDPETKQMLKAMFDHHKVDMDQFTVGNPKNSVNPKTGEIEFGLFSGITKAVKGVFKGVTKAVGSVFGGSQQAPDNSALEKQVAEQSKSLEEQKRRYEKQQADLAKQSMASMRARRRGGAQSLLSEDREEAMLGVKTKLS